MQWFFSLYEVGDSSRIEDSDRPFRLLRDYAYIGVHLVVLFRDNEYDFGFSIRFDPFPWSLKETDYFGVGSSTDVGVQGKHLVVLRNIF